MADYDVQPVGLTTPPVEAFLTAYRPAVATRNNGIHPADVTGLLRIYNTTTGLLIFTCNLAVLSVPPGETRDALGDANWTPEEIGDYQVIASCTTLHDQVPANNNLSPVIINVSEEPPPPPPPVEPHAPQHEAGGTDQLNLDGMHGTLADDQPVATHKASHQEAGDDELNVQDLHGTLADDQPPTAHGSAKHDGTVPTLVDGKVPVEQLPDMPVAEHGSRDHDETVPTLVDGKVPVEQLGGDEPTGDKFLRSDQTWAPGTGAPTFNNVIPTEPAVPSAEGISPDASRADHTHQARGQFGGLLTRPVWIPSGVETTVKDFDIPGPLSGSGFAFEVHVLGHCEVPTGAATLLRAFLYRSDMMALWGTAEMHTSEGVATPHTFHTVFHLYAPDLGPVETKYCTTENRIWCSGNDVKFFHTYAEEREALVGPTGLRVRMFTGAGMGSCDIYACYASML